MDIPDSFKNKLQQVEEREARERAQEKAESARKAQIAQKQQRSEQELYPQKLELSRNIFAWKDGFRSSPEGKKVKKRTVGEVELYYGGWGHLQIPFDDSGSWACLLVAKEFCGDEVVISYRAGYKAQGFRAYFDFKKTEQMAQKLTHAYLQKVWDHLDKGKVWKELEKELW